MFVKTKWRWAESKSKNITISLVCIHCIEVYFFTGLSICIMHYIGKVFSKCHKARATSLTKPPSCSAIHMLIRLTKGETKAQIVACMHTPFSSPFCRQRFVSFGVASCLYVGVLGLQQPLGGILACGRAEAKTGSGWSKTSTTFSRRRATVCHVALACYKAESRINIWPHHISSNKGWLAFA